MTSLTNRLSVGRARRAAVGHLRPTHLRPTRRLPMLAAAMVLATASLVLTLSNEAEAAPTGQPLGIDVASYQHPGGQPIDWRAVRRYGVRWAVVKATEGPTSERSYYVNPYFKQDWNGAVGNGIITGAYHYARPRLPLWSAALDARHFVSTVGANLGRAGLPPILDLEESGGLGSANLAAWTQTWLNEVQRLTGRQPMIYTALWYWNSFMGATNQFSQYPLWVASYASSPGLMPGGWSGWNMWQYTGHGHIPGVPAEVDINVSCGSGQYLVGFCSATRYSTWATTYYNQQWQQKQLAKQAAAGAASGTSKATTPTTKPSTSGASGSSGSSGTSSSGTSSSGTSSSGTAKGTTTTKASTKSSASSGSTASTSSKATTSTTKARR